MLAAPVACRSHGGAYDDASFAAGMRFGEAAARLSDGPLSYAVFGEPELEAAYDLLAMELGYALDVDRQQGEGGAPWAWYTFTKQARPCGGG